MLLGYARVSTADQSAALQDDALRAAGCVRIYTDTASGARDDRPELAAALKALAKGDVLTVWKLDRLGRSLRHLIDVTEDLARRGIGFRTLTEAIDTTTPGGELVFHIFGALAQFERRLIRERTMAGLAAARSRGRTGGRPRKLASDQMMAARQMLSNGTPARDVALALGVDRSTLFRALAE